MKIFKNRFDISTLRCNTRRYRGVISANAELSFAYSQPL